MVEHFRDLGFTHALTLAWNCSRSLDIAESNLKTLHAIVDRKLLGRMFNSKPKAERTMAVFVFEGVAPNGHLHVHSLWRLTDPRHRLKFITLVQDKKDKITGEVIRPGAWRRIVKSGSHKLDVMTDCATILFVILSVEAIEPLQAYSILPGTFDVWDAVANTLGLLGAGALFYVKH